MDNILKFATASNIIKTAKVGGKVAAVGGVVYLILGNNVWSGYSGQSLIDPGNEGKTYSAARSFASGIDSTLGGSYLSKIGPPVELNLSSKWNRGVDATLGTIAHAPHDLINFVKQGVGLGPKQS